MGSEQPRPATTRSEIPPHRWHRVDRPQGEPAVVEAFDAVIAGAGPAGLTAAYELTRHGRPCVVLEADPDRVGGISRTDVYKGYRFDIGGHRFFSKSAEINELWDEILGDQLLRRPRLSRIYYDRKYFYYPLRPVDALRKLGPLRSARILLSYIRAMLWPIRPERSYEDWIVNRFGRMLFNTFFKTYTEKVWGMPTHEITPDWAAQRIKGLSLMGAALNALRIGRPGAPVAKTLIEEFKYPRLGPGQMWEAASDRIQQSGGAVHLGRRVDRIEHDGDAITAFVALDAEGRATRYRGRHFISTLPIRHLIASMSPEAPPEVREAAAGLRYRDFLTVVLIANQPETFPDTWIYVHEPGVRVGRVQNFKNWSPEMVPDPSTSSLGLEYFCFEGDDLWCMADDDLIALGRREIDAMGLVPASSVVDGCVVRMPKAYPVYDEDYRDRVAVVRRWLDRFDNLELAGRNGMHKYNNQDHSMMTALLAARNILGLGSFDTWKVNTDAEYHEEGDDPAADTAGRAVPRRVDAA
jgi:protoporphyrinogen oxidase